MQTIKAIFIDVEKRTITAIDMKNHFEEISKAIGCNYFCCPITLPNEDTFYLDDEGLLNVRNIKGGFTYKSSNPLVGNSIILGTDDEGESIDVASLVEDIAKDVVFITESEAREWAIKVMSIPPTIISF